MLNDHETIKFFKSLYWEYRITEEDVSQIIESGEYKGYTRKNLLGRVLKSCRWYKIIEVLPPELLKEALSDEVLKTLFPKSLADKYYYAREIFYS